MIDHRIRDAATRIMRLTAGKNRHTGMWHGMAAECGGEELEIRASAIIMELLPHLTAPVAVRAAEKATTGVDPRMLKAGDVIRFAGHDPWKVFAVTPYRVYFNGEPPILIEDEYWKRMELIPHMTTPVVVSYCKRTRGVDPRTLRLGDVIVTNVGNSLKISRFSAGFVHFDDGERVEYRSPWWEIVSFFRPPGDPVAVTGGYVTCDVCDHKNDSACKWPNISPDDLTEGGDSHYMDIQICAGCLLQGLEVLTRNKEE